MKLSEALEAAVIAMYKPNHRFLALMPMQKHLERFLGRVWISLSLLWLILWCLDWTILRVLVFVLGFVVWTFLAWLARQKRKYQQQCESIANACSEATGLKFEADDNFKGLINMYYVDQIVKDLIHGGK